MKGEIAKEKLHAIVERLRSGASALIKESQGLGFSHNGPLRAALKGLLGTDGYDELMRGKRPTTRSGTAIASMPDRPRPDDTGLPLIQGMGKSEGWSWRYVSEHEQQVVDIEIKEGKTVVGKAQVRDSGDKLIVAVSPDGKEYIRARDYEKADLLRVDPLLKSSPPIRFVEWEKSETKKEIDRRLARFADESERGQEAREAKKEAKEEKQEKLAKIKTLSKPAEPVKKGRGKKKSKKGKK